MPLSAGWYTLLEDHLNHRAYNIISQYNTAVNLITNIPLHGDVITDGIALIATYIIDRHLRVISYFYKNKAFTFLKFSLIPKSVGHRNSPN